MADANHSCWYREAWQDLWNHATEDEDWMLVDLSVRAGIFWICECGASVPHDEQCDCEAYVAER